MNVHLLARVSTDRQELSADTQETRMRDAAARLGYPVTSVTIEDDTSGTLALDDRDALIDTLSRMKRGDALMAVTRDRLGRDATEVAWLERLLKRRGCRVITLDTEPITDDAVRRLVGTVLDGTAEFEVAMIRRRTRAVLQGKAARGERVSREAPFGYRFEGDRVVPDEREARACARAVELSCAHGATLRGISDQLASEGLLSRSGRPLTASTVRAILRRANGLPPR